MSHGYMSPNLEEEVAMQKSWHEDPQKCTFILLNRERLSKEGGNELSAMVGDTNLYLIDGEDGAAEAEIMVADTSSRGLGIGWEAMLLMLRSGQSLRPSQHLELKQLVKLRRLCINLPKQLWMHSGRVKHRSRLSSKSQLPQPELQCQCYQAASPKAHVWRLI